MNKTNNDLPKIVAIDFDGTLVEDKFPEIGEPNMGMFSLVKALQAQDIRVILWTSRDGKISLMLFPIVIRKELYLMQSIQIFLR